MIKKLLQATVIITAFLLGQSYRCSAQSFAHSDRAPHDISYFRESMITEPLIKVIYGRPTTSKEQIFGEQVELDEVWRTGANESTEIKFYSDFLFGDELIEKGTYSLYTIPGRDEWTVLLNSETDVLGAFQYDAMHNIAKLTVPITHGERINMFSIAFKKTNHQEGPMVLAWGTIRIKVPVKAATATNYKRRTTVE